MKNFRKKKSQIVSIGLIVTLCCVLVCTAANILFSLGAPYEKMQLETKMPSAKMYFSNEIGTDEQKEVIRSFEAMDIVKKVYQIKNTKETIIYYKQKKRDAYCHLTKYDKEIFGSVRLRNGSRSELENLADDECFLPICVAEANKIKKNDVIEVQSAAGKIKYKVKGYFTDPYDTAVAFDTNMLVKKIPEAFEKKNISQTQLLIRTKHVGDEKKLEDLYREKHNGAFPGIMETFSDCQENAQLTNKILGAIFLGIGVIVLISGSCIIYFIIRNTMERDAKKIAIFKTLGYSFWDIRCMYLLFYAMIIITSLILASIIAAFASKSLLDNMMSNLGECGKVENSTAGICLILLIGGFIILFINMILGRMKKIKPIYALKGISKEQKIHKKCSSIFHDSFSPFGMTCRSILRNKKGMTGMLIISIIIAFIINFAAISLNIVAKQKENNSCWLGIEKCDVVANTENNKEFQNVKKMMQNNSDVEKVVCCKRNARMTLHWKKGMGNTLISTMVYHDFKGSDLELVDGRFPRNEKEIVLGTKLLEKYGKEIGDYITADTKDGKKIDYLIVGSLQTYYQLGECIYIRKDGFELTKNQVNENYQMIYLKKGVDKKEFINKMKKNMSTKVSIIERKNLYANIMDDMIVKPQEKSIPAVMLLVLLIGSISIFCIIGLKNRKDEYSNEVYKCIGFNTWHLISANMIYTLIISIISILIALPVCCISYPQIMTISLSVFGMRKYPMIYEWNYMLCANAGFIMIFIFATLISSTSLRKLDVRNLIEE